MKSACGVEFAEASRSVEIVDIEGVAIPFASPELLLRLKNTYRDKDKVDRSFLSQLIEQRKK
jgi:hypothetical protein